MKKKSKKNQKKKRISKNTTPINSQKSEIIEVIQEKFHYQTGQSVIVKNGVSDPDYGTEIGGWKGEIYNIEEGDELFIDIEWDFNTQRKMTKSLVKACEKDNLNYKKMRLRASEVEPYIEQKDNILLKTMTLDLYMLARIHYDLFDKEKIQTIFSKLRCMVFDRTGDRWVWLYEDEARKLKFEGSYNDIPKERRPIILGSFYAKNDGRMYLDVNSFDRARKAIVFFDKYIPRTVARVIYMDVLNKVFGIYDGTLPNHDDYFNDELEIQYPESKINEIIDTISSVKDTTEKIKTTLKTIDEMFQQSIPELERLPIHYYEDGIGGLEGCLSMRETIALRHLQGDKDFSPYDILQKIIEKSTPLKLK